MRNRCMRSPARLRAVLVGAAMLLLVAAQEASAKIVRIEIGMPANGDGAALTSRNRSIASAASIAASAST